MKTPWTWRRHRDLTCWPGPIFLPWARVWVLRLLSWFGAALKAHCQKKLAEAEEKVAQITLDGEGNPKGTTPVDPQ